MRHANKIVSDLPSVGAGTTGAEVGANVTKSLSINS